MGVGKLVRGALYVHRDAIHALADEAHAIIDKAVALAIFPQWNVARLEKVAVGLLQYEEFDAAAFPCLIVSTRVNLVTGEHARTDFSHSNNPLILHRKEQLLTPDDPRVARWAETTRLLVEKGLFRNNHAIGRQKAWTERLARAGLTTAGDEVISAR